MLFYCRYRRTANKKMDKEKLEIEYVNLADIKPYEGNAKQHPDEQVEQIKESIEQFGFDDPLAVWGG